MAVSSFAGNNQTAVPFGNAKNKFGLNYALTIQGPGVDLVIPMPFTIEFDIVRNNYASANEAKFRVYNLSDTHRNDILFDQYVGQFLPPDVPQILTVTLQAGYGVGPNWPVVFTGNIIRAYSQREGVNMITNIEAFDGGAAFGNARSDINYSAGTLQSSVIASLVADLAPYGVSLGAISNSYAYKLAKGGAYSGNTLDLLRDLTHTNFFIDNLKANAIIPTECLVADILFIDSSFGLLNTPIVQETFIELEMLFEPRLAIGTQVNLQSSTAQTYNGVHQIVSIHHHGVISGAVSGQAVSVVGLQKGVFAPVQAQVGV